jgi:hypothetical protein
LVEGKAGNEIRGGEEQKYIKITITVEQTESVSKITKKSMLLSM